MSFDMKDYIAYQEGYEAGKRDAVPRWHRVEEPPKKTAKYLVWVDVNTGVFTAYLELRTATYNIVYKRWYVDGDQRTEWLGTPRYWMPIEPPQEENNGSSRKEASSDL